MQIRPTSPRESSGDSAERNSLLIALPREEYDRVVAESTLVQLTRGRTLIEPDERIPYVWFPQSGVLSIVNDMRQPDARIEVSTIGREGFASTILLHGVDQQPCRVIVQVPGTARRIRAETFPSLLDECPTLARMTKRFAAAAMTQAAQQIACNRFHTLEQRLARWLLATHDHLDSAELPVTQEFLAVMLGVRRPGVTVAAQDLAASGLITYRRGHVRVTDREGLKELACECYATIRAEYERLLGEYMIPRGQPLEQPQRQTLRMA